MLILILFKTTRNSPLEAELQKAFEGVFLMVEVNKNWAPAREVKWFG